MTDTNRPEDISDKHPNENTNPLSDGKAPDKEAYSEWKLMMQSEDWWAVWIGGVLLLFALMAMLLARPSGTAFSENAEKLNQIRNEIRDVDLEMAKKERLQLAQKENGLLPTEGIKAELDTLETSRKVLKDKGKGIREFLSVNPVKGWVSKLGKWKTNPLEIFEAKDKKGKASPFFKVMGVLIVGLVSLILFTIGATVMGESPKQFVIAFLPLFFLAFLAYFLSSQATIKSWNLEYPLWALLVGLVICNTVGTPAFLIPAVRTEFYIKTGLVLLGAKIMLNQLLALGVPGIFVSWVVTPIVLISTYLFGQYVLKIASRSLNMTISADMSVCGVSAAIATAAACKAKKEELSLTIGLSLSFTVVMMFVMPLIIKATGMSNTLGGAWMGGTIDATGAVVAAGAILGEEGAQAAITIKMIQNILIGVIAFFVAIYWVTYVEPEEATEKGEAREGDEETVAVVEKPSAWEIWRRFPKFIIGFIAASVLFTIVASSLVAGNDVVVSMYKGTTDVFRGWFFCLAFVSIGLETNFKQLASNMHGGKPLTLYVVGQTFNLILTLFMAWLMFEVIFPTTL